MTQRQFVTFWVGFLVGWTAAMVGAILAVIT